MSEFPDFGAGTFLNVGTFRLRPSWKALMRRRFVVATVTADDFHVRVIKGADGKFNYATLASTATASPRRRREDAGPVFSRVGLEVVDRLCDRLSGAQLAKLLESQIEIDRLRVIEIVFLALVQIQMAERHVIIVEGKHQTGDARRLALFDHLPRESRLAGARASGHAHDESTIGFHARLEYTNSAGRTRRCSGEGKSRRIRPMLAAFAIFVALLATHAGGVVSYLWTNPSTLDGRSVRLWTAAGIIPLIVAIGFWSVAFGLGHAAAGRCGGRLTGRATPTMAAALGLGALAQAVFIAALAGAMRPVVFAVVFAAALALVAPFLRRGTRPQTPSWNAAQGAAAGFLAYALFCALIRALAPPIEWDVLAYHLALPEIYLKAGKMVDVP